MATGDYGSINQRTAAWAATEMLAHAEPVVVLSKFGQSKPLPKNKADNVKFRRPVPFAAATTPLTEGVTPTAKAMAYEDVSVSIAQYGDLYQITDKVADMAEDPVLKDAAMLCGEQAGETLELITYGVLKGGTNVFYNNGSARNAVNTAVTLNKIRAVVRGLMAQKAKRLTKMLSGSTSFDTKPIEAGYIAFGHTDLEADLRNVTGFTPVANYGSRQPLCPEEVGSVESVRFILSPTLAPIANAGGAKGTMKSTGGTSADVYPIIFIGQDAFGVVPLKGSGAITPSVINPGTIDKSDPLGQRGFVGWKTWFAAVRLNETWIARLEVAATDL